MTLPCIMFYNGHDYEDSDTFIILICNNITAAKEKLVELNTIGKKISKECREFYLNQPKPKNGTNFYSKEEQLEGRKIIDKILEQAPHGLGDLFNRGTSTTEWELTISEIPYVK